MNRLEKEKTTTEEKSLKRRGDINENPSKIGKF